MRKILSSLAHMMRIAYELARLVLRDHTANLSLRHQTRMQGYNFSE